MKTLLLVFVALVFLTGCDYTEKMTNPDVRELGTIDGCEVKYVDRGYSRHGFYMAKCPGNAVTTTRNYVEGKSTRRSAVITEEIVKLETEKKFAEMREAALGKLTPAERKALLVE